ncbi:MAG TPA: hypothetical protein VNN09_14565 [Candidatus Competibacteraceae bacterium]|nr:hypothetical protein [Candidatus Competibacteraceae bacterium]
MVAHLTHARTFGAFTLLLLALTAVSWSAAAQIPPKPARLSVLYEEQVDLPANALIQEGLR